MLIVWGVTAIPREEYIMIKRITVIITAMLVAFMMGGAWSWAETGTQPEKVPHKSYVCKYVGTPGEDERLQTGQNPIWVANQSLTGEKGSVVEVGQEFSDKQGRSIVIVANSGKVTPEPTVEDCPVPDGPPEPVVTTETESRMSCEVGLEERVITTTTEYVKVDGEWVLGEPVVEEGAWTFIRDLTNSEKEELGCENDPRPITTTLKQTKKDCDGYYQRTVTITTLGEEIISKEKSRWVKTGEISKADKVRLECLTPIDDPEKPEPNKPEEPRQPELAATGANTGVALIGGALLLAGAGLLVARRFLTV
jgi:LPXTG-motif cell wall-anchored protein